MAASLKKAMERDVPDVWQLVGGGEFGPVLDWLRTHVHSRGATADPADILGSILSHTLTFDCEGVANIAEGEGNLLDRNPLFVDAAQRDYTLQAASPAVDGGDPLADCAAEPQEACRVDMGHTGNTAAGQ